MEMLHLLYGHVLVFYAGFVIWWDVLLEVADSLQKTLVFRLYLVEVLIVYALRLFVALWGVYLNKDVVSHHFVFILKEQGLDVVIGATGDDRYLSSSVDIVYAFNS